MGTRTLDRYLYNYAMIFNLPSFDKIETLIREVTETEIMPRFKSLASEETWKKGSGSIVTAADIAAEKMLASQLPLLLPGSVVVGEEMVHDSPDILKRLDGSEPVWVLDPVDGTSNFAANSPDFGVMVALVVRRETVAGWIYRPVEDEMYTCERGNGAFLNGAKLNIRPSVRNLEKMVGSLGGFLRKRTNLPERFSRVTASGCIALDYCSLAKGVLDFAHYRGAHVWDHAPGWLLHSEAGGYNRCLDDTIYLAGLPGEGGLLLASDRETWEMLRKPIKEALDTLR